jgi:hypothetical protein
MADVYRDILTIKLNNITSGGTTACEFNPYTYWIKRDKNKRNK